jgi:hypothetical protein
MTASPNFRERRRVRIGGYLFVLETIAAGRILSLDLPARGQIDGWLLLPKGEIDRRNKYPRVTWQGTASDLELMARTLAELAVDVRSDP